MTSTTPIRTTPPIFELSPTSRCISAAVVSKRSACRNSSRPFGVSREQRGAGCQNHMTGRRLLVRRGTVVHGTNAAPFTADILVRGDHISDVGHFDSVDDADILDATGYVVSPGFIDIHSHPDFTL